MNDLVSVIVPTYNCAQYLPEALESVRTQRHRRWELIVVDDGSTDGTASLLEESYPDVRCLRQPNRGIAAARDAGLTVARGPFVAFLDADDVWLPGKLERQLAVLTCHDDCALVFVDGLDFDDSDTERPPSHLARRESVADWIRTHTTAPPFAVGWAYERLLLDNWPIFPSAVLVRTAALRALGGFRPESPVPRREGDYAVWLALAQRHKLAIVSEVLVRRRQRPDSVSRRHQHTGFNDLIVRRHLAQLHPSLPRPTRRRLTDYYLRAGWRHVHGGRPADAREAFLGAWRHGRSARALLSLAACVLRTRR